MVRDNFLLFCFGYSGLICSSMKWGKKIMCALEFKGGVWEMNDLQASSWNPGGSLHCSELTCGGKRGVLFLLPLCFLRLY